MTDSKIVCVLGPPRSGTSLTTMVLNCLGTFFGPKEHLGKPYTFNAKGSWEHLQIVDIDREVLARLGGTWHEPPSFPKDWESDSRFDDLRKRVMTLIRQEFADAPLWGWKNPPTCFTLPFWKSLLPPMHYVICFRNPLDMARSLERRNIFSIEKGFHLWLLYTKAALKHTIGQRRIFVFTEDWISGWQHELRLLSEFLGIPGQAEQASVRSAVQALIDQNLWHSSAKSLSTTLRIYESLFQQEPFEHDDMDRTLQEIIDLMGPDVEKESRKKRFEEANWTEKLKIATKELDSLIPRRDILILVDEQQLGSEVCAGRHSIPFLERDGQYWGDPPDDATAIRELERLRGSGASFIVFGWPAFWWFDHYQELNRYLYSNFHCILHNNRWVVFDIRSSRKQETL